VDDREFILLMAIILTVASVLVWVD